MEDKKLDMSSFFKKTKSLELDFNDLSYSVTLKGNTQKEILHKMNGNCHSGQVTALMGPSGAGKTTLLNVLSWRANQKLTGTININNSPRQRYHKRFIGYVMQKDYFFPQLTVYKSLYYTAHMKRGDLTSSQIDSLLDDILNLLQLNSVKNTRIGDAFSKGISGGELKRLNIATEIISNPSIFFLDEPTTGLDSSSAVSILGVTNNIANIFGINVILSIHQPSSQAFSMLKKIILISDGYIVYQGLASELYAYLAFIGYPNPDGWNVSDFVMDLLYDEKAKTILRQKYFENISVDENKNYYMNHRNKTVQSVSILPLKNDFNSFYNNTDTEDVSVNQNQSKKDTPLSLTEESNELSSSQGSSPQAIVELHYSVKSASYLRLFMMLFLRGIAINSSGSTIFLDLTQSIIIAAVIGVLWFQSMKIFSITEIQDRVGFLFFFTTYWNFVLAFTVLSSFTEERVVIAKERSSKTFPISAYILAKTFTDFLHLFVYPTLWFIIIFFMTGISLTAQKFFGLLFTVMLIAFVSHSIGFTIASMIGGFMPSVTMLILYLLTTLFTGGFYIAFELLPSYLRWIRYISVISYGFSISTYVDIENQDFIGLNGEIIEGSSIRKDYSSGFPIYGDILCLFAMWLVTKTITYLFLRYGKLVKMG